MKVKVNKSIAKRFKKSSSGLLSHRSTGRNHLLSKKKHDRKKNLLNDRKISSKNYIRKFSKLFSNN